jgi:hypothetical protein
MDRLPCSSLIDRFKALDDPRQPRGVRYPWWVLLTLMASALLADCNHCQAMAEPRRPRSATCRAAGRTPGGSALKPPSARTPADRSAAAGKPQPPPLGP